MGEELHFQRVWPQSVRRADLTTNPWVLLLSDWSKVAPQELVHAVESAFGTQREVAERPPSDALVLVVDDLGYNPLTHADAGHQTLLSQLTDAGAVVLEVDPGEDLDVIQNDPVRFAAIQLQRATLQPPVTPPPPGSYQEWLHNRSKDRAGKATGATATPIGQVIDPDGYKEFATPLTRLSPEELKDVFGRSDS